MRLGRVSFSGPVAWPDHVLSYDVAGLIVGVVVQVRSWALGFEVQRSAFSRAWWMYFYVGPWCFEMFDDVEHEYDEVEVE